MVDTFAVFSPDGLSAAFYRSDVHAPEQIPSNAIVVSEGVWRSFLAGGQRWTGSGLTPYVAPAPLATSDAVDAERDRRLALGVSFNGRTYQTRDFDIANMTGAATGAIAAMMQGAQAGDLRWADPTADFAWIAFDNTPVAMDAPTLIGLAQAAMNRRSSLIFVARSIKNRIAAGEVLDVTSDALWPTL